LVARKIAKNTIPFRERGAQNGLNEDLRRRAGLRPTASEAFMPMKPTPNAAPKQARPMCRFPVISANIGVNICVSFRFPGCSRD
jgi:hypothetical protein